LGGKLDFEEMLAGCAAGEATWWAPMRAAVAAINLDALRIGLFRFMTHETFRACPIAEVMVRLLLVYSSPYVHAMVQFVAFLNEVRFLVSAPWEALIATPWGFPIFQILNGFNHIVCSVDEGCSERDHRGVSVLDSAAVALLPSGRHPSSGHFCIRRRRKPRRSRRSSSTELCFAR
jgi:hypothetical protein